VKDSASPLENVVPSPYWNIYFMTSLTWLFTNDIKSVLRLGTIHARVSLLSGLIGADNQQQHKVTRL
jgi:hypothetical protein